ncbi:MAG: flavin reductase family protein [Alphaproteobacteria bacterium]|nr:flavin reductase family protein [Alphaproteobacteria bacterium]MDX5368153.1 flavin reductase family protein [Alphaproteobacteria bacterium]MDX5462984.1 flavin reductase family protein [Alphaproteobacteria bacterium]
MTFDPMDFRRALGCFATGVTVITAHPAGSAPVGITANSFSSVSLEPPLVLWCLDKGSERFARFEAADHFAVNMLAADQEHLSSAFASYERDAFPETPTQTWETGAPILTESLASLDCRIETRVDAGDHVVYIGRVLRLETRGDRPPLLYFRGRYGHIKGA